MAPQPRIPFSPELGEEICSLVASGVDIQKVCNQYELPIQTLHKWRDKYPEFGEAYTRGRARAGEASESRMQTIIDQLAAGELDPNSARVMIDAEKWLAAKRAPRTHGDRVEVEHSGSVAGGLGPVIIQITAHQPAQAAQVIECQAVKPALPDVTAGTDSTLTK